MPAGGSDSEEPRVVTGEGPSALETIKVNMNPKAAPWLLTSEQLQGGDGKGVLAPGSVSWLVCLLLPFVRTKLARRAEHLRDPEGLPGVANETETPLHCALYDPWSWPVSTRKTCLTNRVDSGQADGRTEQAAWWMTGGGWVDSG